MYHHSQMYSKMKAKVMLVKVGQVNIISLPPCSLYLQYSSLMFCYCP